MALTKLPSHDGLVDQQTIQVQGPDTLVSTYAYDKQTRTLYSRNSGVLSPSLHGMTHISEDPIPDATCDTAGLMAEDDKCKLDALLQTRFGVLGFQGAGFPDDGGWMQGDIILAAGSEFISLERIGNIIRFTVDSPLPMNCSCEACAQVYWVQDETEVAALRPPSCAGKMPGVNGYGELKFYLLPESMIVDPSNPSTSLSNKGQYPSLVFKRYDDSITPGLAELEVVLKRDSHNYLETSVGWAFTPGAGTVAECVWFMGEDNDGNRMRFELNPESDPGILGSLLYKGHLLTKKMGVVVGYTSHVLSTNQYTCKWWDVVNAQPASEDNFTATNVWQYTNAEGGANSRELVLDRTHGLLSLGMLVDIWFFQIGEVGGQAIRQHYISKKPDASAIDTWTQSGGVEFGTLLTARDEFQPDVTSSNRLNTSYVDDARNFERTLWGLTGFGESVMLYDEAGTAGVGEDYNDQHRAVIDTQLPGLSVEPATTATEPYNQRPVWLWNRQMLENSLLTMDIGRPETMGTYPPYDIMLNAPIDNNDNIYLRCVSSGSFPQSGYYLLVKGAGFRDLPQQGSLRIINGTNRNEVWSFTNKLLFPGFDDDAVALVGATAFPGVVGDLSELLHQEYNGPCVRLGFTWSTDSEVQLQIKVGTLSHGTAYEEDTTDDIDDIVRGLAPGYATSAVYTQESTYSGVGDLPTVDVDGFLVYDGGYPSVTGGSGDTEYWNELEILNRGDQVWIWWNGLLIPPSTALSSALATPVTIATPYFPITQPSTLGKVGMRMWPGAKVRRMIVRAPARAYSEYTRGQLELA